MNKEVIGRKQIIRSTTIHGEPAKIVVHVALQDKKFFCWIEKFILTEGVLPLKVLKKFRGKYLYYEEIVLKMDTLKQIYIEAVTIEQIILCSNGIEVEK
jgi:hypothetical protein